MTRREQREAAAIESHEVSCGGVLDEWDCGCSFECRCDAWRENRRCRDCGALFRVNASQVALSGETGATK